MSTSLLDRRALRQRLIAAREALGEAERSRLTTALSEHLGGLLMRLAPHTLAFCWPWRSEPDLVDFLVQWQAQTAGRTLALPIVPEVPGPLAFHVWTASTLLLPDRFGIPAPQGSSQVIPDLVLVPLNGFDEQGYRLGYGGGYFDRTLAATPLPTVGVGFEIARVPDLQPEPHDRPLDWVVTEAGATASRA